MWYVPNPETGRKPLPYGGLLHYELQVFISQGYKVARVSLPQNVDSKAQQSYTETPTNTLDHTIKYMRQHTGETQKHQHLLFRNKTPDTF